MVKITSWTVWKVMFGSATTTFQIAFLEQARDLGTSELESLLG